MREFGSLKEGHAGEMLRGREMTLDFYTRIYSTGWIWLVKDNNFTNWTVFTTQAQGIGMYCKCMIISQQGTHHIHPAHSLPSSTSRLFQASSWIFPSVEGAQCKT